MLSKHPAMTCVPFLAKIQYMKESRMTNDLIIPDVFCMFEITIDRVNMVENERTTQSGNVRELSFFVSICLSRTSENSKCFPLSP